MTMSIAAEREQIEKQVNAEHEVTDSAQADFINTKYRGIDWYQLTDAEIEVFGLAPENMPRLVAAHELYYCAVEIMFEISKERVKSIRAELPWLSSGLTDGSEWSRFAALFGISNRQAHAFFCKYDFWDERMGIVTYRDEEKA